MTRESLMRRRWTAALGLWCVAGVFAGCNDNDLGIDRRRPNRPPETILSSGPPDSTRSTNYRVQLFWSGSDPDGTIDHFDYVLVDHPASDSTISGQPTDPNQVVVRIPERDDPRWRSTNANDTLIVTIADTLRRNPRPNPDDPNDSNDIVRNTTFERWHTFFVRAVDNEGVEDVSPEFRSFNSRTIAPTVRLTAPIKAGEVFVGPRTIVFNWDGQDPIGDGNNIQPVAARWVLVPTRRTVTGFLGYPDSLYYLPRTVRWSEWYDWERSDGRGRQAIVRNLIPVNSQGQGRYMFAVQAMDEAGAVTPVFDFGTTGSDKNNVSLFEVTDYVGSTLTVSERVLGTYTFVGGSRPVILDMAAGQVIEFRWNADATTYGGTITGYRYGWNIRNPEVDEQWDQNWNSTVKKSAPRTFNAGVQRFFLEARDNAETVTHAEIELVVRQVTRSKDLLLVDDTEQPDDRNEPLEDARWRTVVDSLVARRPSLDFQASRDIYDVVENRRFPPPIARVFDYKTIVWAVVQGRSGSALNTLGRFFDPFLRDNIGAVVPFNYLTIYLDNGGEMWVAGDQPAHVIWPVTRQPDLDQQFPVNVTNWIDPTLTESREDSVGVPSLLFKLGVEMFDLGGGGRAPNPRRDRIDQNCLGFRRSTPDSLQRFTSDQRLEHSHTLDIRLATVESPPAGGTILTTSRVADHTHTVTLSQADLRRLARGDRLTIATTSADLPAPHTHNFQVVDQRGLWGAPLDLFTDFTWPLPREPGPNPFGTRPNVEIYNHPLMLANPRIPPPLQPDRRVWLPLYLYRSRVQANETGTVYPLTADGSPSVILRKFSPDDAYYSRALCGFEPWLLRFDSHLALADFILLRHMRLGLAETSR